MQNVKQISHFEVTFTRFTGALSCIQKIPTANMASCQTITKTYLYNFDPLKPQFYIVKLGITGVYIIFLISAKKYKLWELVRTASVRRF